MRIAVIIPDRGDRPEFLEQCKKMLASQTMQPETIYVAGWKPETSDCDITQRYRIAYHNFDGMNYDCILFIENDDYYAPNYIETMVNGWISNGKPEIFGTAYTIYYHIGMLKYEIMNHPARASAMSTLIKPDLDIKWPIDKEPYTDMHLWKQLKGVTFKPENPISMGIKHGIGKGGGHYHNTKLERYKESDEYCQMLRTTIDNDSIDFYINLHNQIKHNFI